MEEKNENKKKENPRKNANFISALTFWWMVPIFRTGYKRDLGPEDLFEVLDEHDSERMGNILTEAWNKEISRTNTPSLSSVLIQVFGSKIALYGIWFGVLELFVKMLQPVAIGYLVMNYSSNVEEQSIHEIYMYSGTVMVCSVAALLIYYPTLMGTMHTALKIKVALASLIYRKALKVDSMSMQKATVGQVINLLSNDINKFDLLCLFCHNLWIGPLVTLLVSYIMYQEIGFAALVGILIVILFIPFQGWLTKLSKNINNSAAKKTDERLQFMNEIIKGIQIIKMYAWEVLFSKAVLLARRNEIQFIKHASYIKGVHIAFTVFRTRTAIFISFLTYVLCGNTLTAQKVFVVTACFNTMKRTVTDFFSYAIELAVLANVSIKRIQKFLLLDEKDCMMNFNEEINRNVKKIFLKNVSAKWDDEQLGNTLKQINFEINSEKNIGIIGKVGSGKSSLLQVILKELRTCEGCVEINAKISYASQDPWIFPASIKQNILFGEKFDYERYTNILRVCALDTDLSHLPYKDETIVGERGATLSGGQKMRVNLARAIYRNADVYLLDDPFSAVDSHVGNHIFEQAIKHFLSTKICILITHQHQYLKQMERIIVMHEGNIKTQGTYEELKEEISNHIANNTDTEIIENNNFGSGVDFTSLNGTKKPEIVQEKRSMGKVSWEVYMQYLRACGNPFCVSSVFILFVFAQMFASAADYFIGYWVNIEQSHQKNESLRNYDGDSTWNFIEKACISTYTGANVLTVLVTVASCFFFFNISMCASFTLHNNMFNNILKATMRFFNDNPSGRILTRFSKDLKTIDELIPSTSINFIQSSLSILGIVIIVAIIQPWLIIPSILAFVFLILLRNIYITVSSGIKRLEGTTCSPLLSYTTATLQGLTTIRAFQAQRNLQKEFDTIQNTHTTARYLFTASARMFAMWLETVCVIYLALVIGSFLVSGNEQYGGNVGLAITQVISMMGLIQWAVRQSSDLENNMTSVERVIEYDHIETETSKQEMQHVENWPNNGQINFHNVSLQYCPGQEPILKNLSFIIHPKEKIGIVGRTGAGKTSLISALFQLYKIKGSIIIDDINLQQMDLLKLRSKISIIPQEPLLFSGTIRKNLDPFGEFSDEQLWKTLEEVEMKPVITDLNMFITEGGHNFSVGQRQLICLARALIRSNKILVLDEATSNLDPDTDELLQKTIRKKFIDCTVLTIAHRLENVMDSDRIMVIENGVIKEFDEPYLLLKNIKSYLYFLIKETDEIMTDKLYHIAKQNYDKKHNLK